MPLRWSGRSGTKSWFGQLRATHERMQCRERLTTRANWHGPNINSRSHASTPRMLSRNGIEEIIGTGNWIRDSNEQTNRSGLLGHMVLGWASPLGPQLLSLSFGWRVNEKQSAPVARLRLREKTLAYSFRRAITGSTRDARCAGTKHAKAATARRVRDTTATIGK